MRGGAWLGTGSIAEQTGRFARNMLLARLLIPNDFGTMAIVLSSASVVNTLTDVGERAAIIQNPRGSEPAYLNASWWLSFSRNLFSYLIIFCIAPWVSHFYGRPEICSLLRVALLAVLFDGALSPHSYLAQRQMRLGRWAVITNGGALCGVAATVILSFVMRNVWALAIGYCSEYFFRFLFSYVICPGLPRFRIDWQAVRSLLNFSRGVFGMAPLNLIITRADVFVLGRLYSMAALGLYTMGVNLVVTPSAFITNMIGQTLLPTMSGIQEDSKRLNRILLEVTSWLLLLGLPMTVFVILSAPSLLRLAYGSRYMAATGPLSVAAVAVLLTVLNALPTTVLFAKGFPGLHRYAVIVMAVVMAITVYPASKFIGPVGAQLAALLAVGAGLAYQVIRLKTITGLSLRRYASIWALPALGSIAIVGAAAASRLLGFAVRPVAHIVFCLLACAVVTVLCAFAHLRKSQKERFVYCSNASESTATP